MYVNGRISGSTTYNFELSPIPLTYFSMVSALGGGAHYLGLIDEFRISNVPRSALEICNSYMMGNGNFSSLQVSPSAINIHPGWEIFLNSPNSFQCPQVLGILGANSFPVWGACISWAVSDPAILQLNTSTLTLKALAIGTANLIGTVGTNSFTIPVTVTRLQALGEPDLSVRYIKRLPEINYVQNSSNPTVEGWPSAGQTITWRAHIRNWSGNTYNNVSYEWKKNGTVIGTGVVNFLPDLEATVQINDTWAFQRDSIEFTIDKTNSIAEYNEVNNSLKVYTDAISLNMYVEQSMYDYFHLNQYKLGVNTNSFDDWMQILHVKRWNNMFKNAIYPEAPNGVLDRIRVDSIVIVPDHALPLAGGLPSNNPNVNDKTVDLLWGIDYGTDFQTFFSNQTTVSDANAFYFYGGLLHELGHARYLIDNYALNLTNLQVSITEGTVPVAGSSLLPFIAFDVVYYTPKALMSGYYDTLAISETMELNLIAHRRAVCGNMNSPCNIGIFINDLPANNFITLKDQNNNLLSNACVKIYRSVSVPGFYNKDIDNIPDLSFTANTNGTFNAGRNPFAATNSTPISGVTTMDIIIRVEKNGKVGYKVIEATDFNIEYWRGNIVNGNYTYQVNMLNCSDFSGSSCSCAQISPPIISAGGLTTFCQGSNVILTSNLANGNQWFKDGVAINGATGTTLTVTTGGNYTATVTVNGNQSAASNEIVVTVNSTILSQPVSIAGSNILCQGSSQTYSIVPVLGATSYIWTLPIGWTGSSTSTSITVTAGNNNGIISVRAITNCSSSNDQTLNVTVSALPSTQSNFSSIGFVNNSITINLSPGNGSRRVVIMNTVNNFTTLSNGTSPIANTVYTGSGEQVIYNNVGNSVTVTGVSVGTNYCFRVFEANCTGTFTLYNTTTSSNNPTCLIEILPPVPDLTPVTAYNTLSVAAGGYIDNVVAVKNNGTSATSAPIIFKVTKYPTGPGGAGITVTSSPNPTVTIGPDTYNLDNANWTVSDGGSDLIFTSNPGVSINPTGLRYVGIRITRGVSVNAGTNGTISYSVVINFGTGGGELPTNNNLISARLIKY